ncbi:MAG: M18 family aminopeptidase [Sandaracinaceae bacterium]|nr:M18 family aminopeptidase [Sandaracinaceae bacterium]
MTAQDLADDLLDYLDASPTAYHAVAETTRRLRAAGYRELLEKDAWKVAPGERVYVTRAQTSILAFELGTGALDSTGMHLVGAHTDSPNLRIKPVSDLVRAGYQQFAIEVYGGVLWHSWLDRDLALAGRVLIQGTGVEPVSALVRIEEPWLRIPNLAIHLQRGVNTEGLILNPQLHLVPIAGLESAGLIDLKTLLGARVGAKPNEVLSFDLALYDTQKAARAGLHREFVQSARLDNLASCHVALSALLATSGERERTRGVVLYDHEEVGSRSAQGADSPFLRTVIERLCEALGKSGTESYARTAAQSYFVSADMAHAIHPNYQDRHEPSHQPLLGRGPVIKSNVNQSYATDGESAAIFEALCRRADVAPQHFVTRTDLGCGSTIGPITASQLGMRSVDVGNPMLSMHSIREMCAASDIATMAKVLTTLFEA